LIAEAFRSLRTSLFLLGKEEDRRTFLVTSAIPAEGKTFISSSLAVAFAQGGLKTLIIDADLRKPTVSRVFFGKSYKPGLTELLVGHAAFADVIRSTKVENLFVMPAGERAPNPAELLTKIAIREVIKTALKTYDRVIIDTAPVLAVSDTLMIADEVRTVCLAVRSGMTPRGAVERACKLLADAGNVPAGLVMNRMPVSSSGYYYYYGHYGSKEVYGASVDS
jgi:capsular exopolysaccharide synthesis family protein